MGASASTSCSVRARRAPDWRQLAPVGSRASSGGAPSAWRWRGALERALEGAGGTVAIRGEPGVGKSRLVHEFARECRERGLRVELVRAFAHGRAVPLRPVLAMLRTFFGIEEGDEPTLARERIEAAMLDLDLDFAMAPSGLRVRLRERSAVLVG